MTGSDLRRRLDRARAALRDGRFDAALPLLDGLARELPDRWQLWHWRAGCLARLGRVAEALDSARRAVALAPGEERAAALVRSLEARLGDATAPVGPPSPAAPAVTIQADVPAVEATLVEDGRAATGGPRGGAETQADVSGGGTLDATLVEDAPAATVGAGVTVDAAVGQAAEVPATLAEADGDGSPAATLADAGDAPRAVITRDQAPGVGDDPLPTLVDHRPRPAGGGFTPGEVIEGRYEVRGGAQGGMGEVSFVLDRELGLELAIKTPLASALRTAAGRARFLREAEAWIALGLHPNICTAYYVRELAGLPRLFIEYLPGGTLEEWLASHPAAPSSQRLELAIQVAAGMHHAHTVRFADEEGREHRGLIHRDLKPANILLGADGAARVTDFGLVGRDADLAAPPPATAGHAPSAGAGAVTREAGTADTLGLTRTGSVWSTMTLGGKVLGSPPYMAPEQWTGSHAAGRAADLYAFGCILFELVCGRRPFALGPRYRQAGPEVQRRTWEHLHRSQPPPDPRELVAGLDEGLARLVLACLGKDPAARPGSFAEVGRALREAYGRVTGSPYPRPEPQPAELLADSLTNRGVSFASLGRPGQAEEAWRAALAADPRHPQAAFNLALAQWLRGEVSDRQLAERVESGRAEGPSAWRQQLLAGRAQLAVGRLPDAVERLRAAAAAGGDAPEAVCDLAAALAGQAVALEQPERWAEVAATVRRAGAAADDDPVLLTVAALAAGHGGDAARAEELWAEARRRLPDPPVELARGARRLIPGATFVRRLAGAGAGAVAVDVSRDGRLALAISDLGRLSLHDLEGAGPVRGVRGRPGRCRAVALAGERGLGLTATDGDAVVVWDLAAGVARRTLQLHSGTLNALVCGAAGRTVAAVGSAGTLLTWDLDSGRRLLSLKVLETFGTALALAADGSRAAVGGGDGGLRVVELPSGRLVGELAGHQGEVTAVAFTPDLRQVVSGGADGVLCRQAVDGVPPPARCGGHDGPVRLVAVSADGRRVLSAAGDGTVRVRELGSGELLAVVRVADDLRHAAAAADWSAVVLVHGDELSQLCLRDIPRYRPPWAVARLVSAAAAEEGAGRFRSHLQRVRRLAAEQDFATAFHVLAEARSVAGYERSREALEVEARLAALFPRDALRDAWEEWTLPLREGGVTAVAVSPRRQRAAAAGRDRQLVLLDLDGGAEVARRDGGSIVTALALLADGRTAVAAHLDDVVRRWDLEGTRRPLPMAGHQGRVNDLAVDPAGRTLLTVSADHTGRVWEPAVGECRHVLEGHLGPVLAAAVRPDGRLGATGGDDGSVLLWDLDRGRPAGELAGVTAAVTGLAWSLDGRYVLVAAQDGRVRLFDLHTRRVVRTLAEGLTAPGAIAFTPDARWALVGEESGRVGLWDLRGRRLVRALDPHAAGVVGVGVDRSGRQVLSGAADGGLRLSYLDWQPRVRPFAEWDEAARPHLEMFLSRHRRGLDGAGEAVWREEEVRELLVDLGHRGLGWLRPDGVRARLEEARSASPVETAAADALPVPARATTPHSRERRGRTRSRLLAAALLVAALAAGGQVLRSRAALRFDGDELAAQRRRNLALYVLPAATSRPADCRPGELGEYVREFTDPGDSIAAWSAASYCLVALKDPRVVPLLLDSVRHRGAPAATDELDQLRAGADPRVVRQSLRRALLGGVEPREAVQSILARVGVVAVPALSRALADGDPEVRRTAAGALAMGGSEEAAAALLERGGAGDAAERSAVAAQLPSLATNNHLDLEDVFGLAARLAADPDPGVRRALVPGLRLFRGSRARAVLEDLQRDPDPEVRRAAQALPPP